MTEIPKLDKVDWEPNKPGWVACVSSDGKPIKPIIVCNCGQPCGIGLHHVHADGTVTASFYHKRGNGFAEDPKGCEWHVFLKLKDYDLGEFPSERGDERT